MSPKDEAYDVLYASFPSPPNVRVANALWYMGCRNLRDAIKYSREEWVRRPNFGKKSLQELEDSLFDIGLKLCSEPRVPAKSPQPWFKFAF